MTSRRTDQKQKEQYKRAAVSFTHFNGWLLCKWLSWAHVRLKARSSERLTFCFWALVQQVCGESRPECLSFSFSEVHFSKYSTGILREHGVNKKHCVTCKLLGSAYDILDTCLSIFYLIIFNPHNKSMNYLYSYSHFKD